MAGELILPLSRKPPLSVDYATTAALSRGDLVELPGGPGFALADANANTTVAVGVQSPMVSVPQPTTARAWKAGEPVYLDHDNEFVHQTNIARWRIGWCHEDTAIDAKRVPVVWSPSEGHYYRRFSADTTPKLADALITSQQNVAENGSWETTLLTTDLKGIRQGAIVHFEYDGDLVWLLANRKPALVITIITTLWHSISARAVSRETTALRYTAQGQTNGISMASFSEDLDAMSIGTSFTSDGGNAFTVGKQDFDDGIPFQIKLRVAPKKADDLSAGAGGTTRISSLSINHGHLVITQEGRQVS